jgi:L-aminopeptidase/D-esterase-like protein
MMIKNDTITAVPGIRVGHAQNEQALTGCTVIICEKGAIGGVDQRGGAPGTRETDLLHPMHLVQRVHSIVLSGGSAFGLDAASGVMKYLEERKIGFNAGVARVPIVSSAILFDLGLGKVKTRPDASMGYQACQNATEKPVTQGNVGAGTGATVGKLLGGKRAMKSGLGSASTSIGNGIIVGAIVAVNAIGDVIDPDTRKILAGARALPGRKGKVFLDSLEFMRSLAGRLVLNLASHQNTVIGVVATNAKLTKEEANKVAQMAHDGLALTIRPAHTMMDGDTIFSMATGQRSADVNIVGAFAAQVFAQAILNAVRNAKSVPGLPAASDVKSQ